MLTAKEPAPRPAPATVWPAGLAVAANVEETLRRTGSHPAHPGPGTIEYFAGVRVDPAIEETLNFLSTLDPDLLVAEELDHLGPLAATMPKIPWVEHRGAMVSTVDAAGFDVLATADDLPAAPGVHALGFVPLAKLLPEVDVVVSAGGTGTVLAALTAGLPLVLRPFFADPPWNAAQGAAIVIDAPADAGEAARRIMNSADHRTAAATAAEAIGTMNSAEHVIEQLAGLPR
ncbi:glycosyltransferase [Amycolatopsis sp. NPDC004747]